MPGATSRWNRGKDLSWEPLRIERVCEVAYDHLQGDRFRHATTFVRWRPTESRTRAATTSSGNTAGAVGRPVRVGLTGHYLRGHSSHVKET